MPECGVEKVSKRRLKGTRSTKGRIWLASDRDHSKIIDYDRLWRVNAEGPRHYAGPSLSLVAMTQFETLISHLMRLVVAYLGHDLGLCRR